MLFPTKNGVTESHAVKEDAQPATGCRCRLLPDIWSSAMRLLELPFWNLDGQPGKMAAAIVDPGSDESGQLASPVHLSIELKRGNYSDAEVS